MQRDARIDCLANNLCFHPMTVSGSLNLGTMDVCDPDVAVAIDRDAGIVGVQWYAVGIDPVALKPHPVE